MTSIVRLLVQRDRASRGSSRASAFARIAEERRVVEAELRCLRAEVDVQEVRRVTEVARPAEQVHLAFPAWTRAR